LKNCLQCFRHHSCTFELLCLLWKDKRDHLLTTIWRHFRKVQWCRHSLFFCLKINQLKFIWNEHVTCNFRTSCSLSLFRLNVTKLFCCCSAAASWNFKSMSFSWLGLLCIICFYCLISLPLLTSFSNAFAASIMPKFY